MVYLESGKFKALLTSRGKLTLLSGGLIKEVENGYVGIFDDNVNYTLDVAPTIFADFSGNDSDITNAKCGGKDNNIY